MDLEDAPLDVPAKKLSDGRAIERRAAGKN
jgi:hypothetical protein